MGVWGNLAELLVFFADARKLHPVPSNERGFGSQDLPGARHTCRLHTSYWNEYLYKCIYGILYIYMYSCFFG